MADFEKTCFSLKLDNLKSMKNDGEPAPAVETLSMSEISNQDGNRIAEHKGNSDRLLPVVNNLYLGKLKHSQEKIASA